MNSLPCSRCDNRLALRPAVLHDGRPKNTITVDPPSTTPRRDGGRDPTATVSSPSTPRGFLAGTRGMKDNLCPVLVIRPTQILASRLKVNLQADAEGSTLLGDWSCHVIRVERRQLILAVSEEARLPVLLPVRGKGPFEARLVTGVEDVLRGLGVPDHAVAEEVARMRTVAYAKTNSRSVLGSMKDYSNLTEGYLGVSGSLLDVALRVADSPSGPLKMRKPREVACELLIRGRS